MSERCQIPCNTRFSLFFVTSCQPLDCPAAMTLQCIISCFPSFQMNTCRVKWSSERTQFS